MAKITAINRVGPLLIIGCLLLLGNTIEFGLAQVTGEVAEMDRLEQRADELAALADAEGAALAIGKAAMMADILAEESHTPSQRIFQGASLLYRAQERGFRALALFERTGGTPPAPAGVCHFLFQGQQKLHDSKILLQNPSSFSREEDKNRKSYFLGKIREWENLLQGLEEDFMCADPPSGTS